jgi:ATP-dependent Clp protease ATP-binding subunit ClpA
MNNHTTDTKILLPLDTNRRGPVAERFLDFVKTRAVGQSRIFHLLGDTIEAYSQGFLPERGPAGTFLFVGPSGVGKTYPISLMAEFLFGDPKGFTRVDGQTLSESHGVARLTGSPPGYIGYNDEPMITQAKLDGPAYRNSVLRALLEVSEAVREEYRHIESEHQATLAMLKQLKNAWAGLNKKERKELQAQFDAREAWMKENGIPLYDPTKYAYLSLLLFDEIEKADRNTFPNLLLGILDEGELPLTSPQDDNESGIVSFRNTIIIATSNLGSHAVTDLLRVSSGCVPNYAFKREQKPAGELDDEIYKICRKEVDLHFSTEFVNRFGDVTAARPLSIPFCRNVLNIEIAKLRKRLFDPRGIDFPVEPRFEKDAREYLVSETMKHPERGIRFLQHKIYRRVESVLSRLRATEQITEGDSIRISLDSASGKFIFHKEERSGTSKKIIVVE